MFHIARFFHVCLPGPLFPYLSMVRLTRVQMVLIKQRQRPHLFHICFISSAFSLLVFPVRVSPFCLFSPLNAYTDGINSTYSLFFDLNHEVPRQFHVQNTCGTDRRKQTNKQSNQ